MKKGPHNEEIICCTCLSQEDTEQPAAYIAHREKMAVLKHIQVSIPAQNFQTLMTNLYYQIIVDI